MPASQTVVAAALGECVHVAGVMNFLRLAEITGRCSWGRRVIDLTESL
jgi:hypothetical protein